LAGAPRGLEAAILSHFMIDLIVHALRRWRNIG
jgi:hypothetical protein